MMKQPERLRVVASDTTPGRFGRLTSQPGDPGGLFLLPRPGKATGAWLACIADNGLGSPGHGTPATHWEHVSVSLLDAHLHKRTPTWEEMCAVKDYFWPGEACVLQFHPPRSEYVDLHPFCLHLWRSLRSGVETPPKNLVG